MKFLCIFVIANLFSLNQGYQFHHLLTDQEVEKVFNVPREQVPEYDIVEINHKNLRKRSLSTVMSIKVFNKNHQFNFDLNENFLMGKNTPLYIAKSYFNGPRKVTTYTMARYNSHLVAYHDVKQKAAIVTSRNQDGKLEIRGTINENMFIQPLSSFLKKLKSDSISRMEKLIRINKRSTDNFSNLLNTDQHIIIKNNRTDFNKEFCQVMENSRFNLSESKHVKRDVVDVIYPQLLLTVDYDIYKAHNFDKNELVRYLFALYNAVDLRYRTVDQPKIRFNIAAIIVAQEPGAFSFLDERVNGTFLISSLTLSSMSQYFASNPYFARLGHDITVAMTGTDILGQNGSDYYRGILGVAYEKGVCYREPDIDLSVALVEDQADYYSVNVIAHELGHLFGAPHDGLKNLTDQCMDYSGYMFPFASRAMRSWSDCSQERFHNYLSHPRATCLRNKPHVKKVFPKIFPGQIVESLDEQCNLALPGSSTKMIDDDEYPCKSLICELKENGGVTEIDISGALDGTPCQNNRGMCLEKECMIM